MPLFSLRNEKAFELVKSCGKKISTPYFILIFAKQFSLIQTTSNDPTFLGMKVSRKFSKKAVIRNKAKRRIRHLIRLMLKDPELDLTKTATIFIPYKNFEQIEFAKLSIEVKNALKKGLKYS